MVGEIARNHDFPYVDENTLNDAIVCYHLYLRRMGRPSESSINMNGIYLLKKLAIGWKVQVDCHGKDPKKPPNVTLN